MDDRSNDATGRILDEFAAAHPRLRVVHITELPPGWLGKPHALQKAYEASTGDWLLFTDADVRFKPDALRRAVALSKASDLDHLTLMGDVEMEGFWENGADYFFWHGVSHCDRSLADHNPNSRAYMGVGAFQLAEALGL